MGMLRKIADAVLSGKGGQAQLATLVLQNPKLMQAAIGLLAKDSLVGGLQGLVTSFENAGLGDTIASWLGSGTNKPVSGTEIEKVLGGGVLDGIAAQARMTPSEASDMLSRVLPGMIDKLSPTGEAHALDISQIKLMLGGFLKGNI